MFGSWISCSRRCSPAVVVRGCEVGKMGGMERKRERIGKRARTREKRVCKD